MKATSGASKMGKPFLSNGANFAYSRIDFRELNPFQNHERIASGDDVFLLHEFKKRSARDGTNRNPTKRGHVYIFI